ncbi:MAG: 30S ribosomal protein S3 [Defluviitaleaceae bacterium]|nr:30S ribosomal protein S3 [Defluviitaleaceae bacterium]
MGQKVNPHGLRLGINKEWDSVWYAEKDFSRYLLEDHNIRQFIKKYFKNKKPVPVDPKIARITIKRTTSRVKVTLHTASPGIIIGRNGEAIKMLTDAVQKLVDKGRDPDAGEYKADVEIQEIKRPELNAQLTAEVIAKDLENRVTFRRAMKQAMTRAMKNGARGIKTAVSGRLGGADIARTESYHEGTIPLQTLRADIDYGFAEADTTYGKLGVKVWLYKGEVLPGQERQREDRPYRGDRREGAGDYANAKKGKKTQAVPRSNDRKGTAR